MAQTYVIMYMYLLNSVAGSRNHGMLTSDDTDIGLKQRRLHVYVSLTSEIFNIFKLRTFPYFITIT